MRYRPAFSSSTDSPDEKWDLFALGSLVAHVIKQSPIEDEDWKDWKTWTKDSIDLNFNSIPQSMEALPGVNDISVYGVQPPNKGPQISIDEEALIKEREAEWKHSQLVSSLKFKRNMTLLVGSICLISYFFTKVYLYFYPSPWVEYSMEGVSDHYQLGFGLWSGKAWGILPAAYDDEHDGGQDIAGEWIREEGTFKLKFRKFKKMEEEEGGKKLWQFIGKGATSPDDYYIWEDHLKFNQGNNSLTFIKRLHDGEEYLAARSGNEVPRLYPDVRIKRSGGRIVPCDLTFMRVGQEGLSWSFFIGSGF